MTGIIQTIEKLEDLKLSSQRLANYELAIINEVISELKNCKVQFTENDMHKAFKTRSQILYDNHSLDYLKNYLKFMQDNYHLT